MTVKLPGHPTIHGTSFKPIHKCVDVYLRRKHLPDSVYSYFYNFFFFFESPIVKTSYKIRKYSQTLFTKYDHLLVRRMRLLKRHPHQGTERFIPRFYQTSSN